MTPTLCGAGYYVPVVLRHGATSGVVVRSARRYETLCDKCGGACRPDRGVLFGDRRKGVVALVRCSLCGRRRVIPEM